MFDYDLLIYDDFAKIFVLNYFFKTIREYLYFGDNLQQVFEQGKGQLWDLAKEKVEYFFHREVHLDEFWLNRLKEYIEVLLELQQVSADRGECDFEWRNKGRELSNDPRQAS